jgi:hypothetical protein
MPKNRKRAIMSGAKSTSIRTKNKIGGRKSGRGTGTMRSGELLEALSKCRKRDRNKLERAYNARLITA